MIKNNVAIIGYGYVGKGMHKIFPDASIYDTGLGHTEEQLAILRDGINRDCELAIISVPTPMGDDGSCDTSIVESAIQWVRTPLILIKSTVPPGTTNRLRGFTIPGQEICFSPEYIGEGNYFVPPWKYPDPLDPRSHGFFIVGGPYIAAERIVQIFMRKLGPDCVYRITDSDTAELTKYMENSWGATKVTFANEFYSIAEAFGVSYAELRELFLLDKRTERMHTAVFEDSRGFGGKCFPKDVNAIVKAAESAGYIPALLKEVLASNEKFKKQND